MRYLDGSYDKYSSLIRELKDKANWTCSVCGFKGTTKNGTKGEILVHHIDRNPDNNNVCNLVVLCARCHDRVTYGRCKKVRCYA